MSDNVNNQLDSLRVPEIVPSGEATGRVGIGDLDFGKSLPTNPLIDRPFGLPDVNRNPAPIQFPRLYVNPNAQREDSTVLRNFANTLRSGAASVENAISRANAIEAERIERLNAQTEMTRKAIQAMREEENTGLAAFFFGRKKNYQKNRTVNPLAGEWGEQGGGLLGFLGYVTDSFSSAINTINAESFRGVNPTDPNAAYRAGSNFWRKGLTAFFAPKPFPLFGTKEEQDAYVAERKRALADFAQVFGELQRLDKTPGNANTTALGWLPKSWQSVILAASPLNWTTGLNPFVNDVALNNAKVVGKHRYDTGAFFRNIRDVFTKGRSFHDSNNPFTKDGLFYDPKRLDKDGKDTYSTAQKIASGIWMAVRNPGDAITSRLLFEPLVKPALSKGGRALWSALPFKKKVINKVAGNDLLLESYNKANAAIKKADEVLARQWYRLPDNVEGEKVASIINRYGGVRKAREALAKITDENEAYKLKNALNINEMKREATYRFQKSPNLTMDERLQIEKDAMEKVEKFVKGLEPPPTAKAPDVPKAPPLPKTKIPDTPFDVHRADNLNPLDTSNRLSREASADLLRRVWDDPPKQVSAKAVAEAGVELSSVSRAGVVQEVPKVVVAPPSKLIRTGKEIVGEAAEEVQKAPVPDLSKLSTNQLLESTGEQLALGRAVPTETQVNPETIRQLAKAVDVPEEKVQQFLVDGAKDAVTKAEKQKIRQVAKESALVKVESVYKRTIDELAPDVSQKRVTLEQLRNPNMVQIAEDTLANVKVRLGQDVADPWDFTTKGKDALDIHEDVAEFISKTAQENNIVFGQAIPGTQLPVARRVSEYDKVLNRVVPKGELENIEKITKYFDKVLELNNGEIPAKEISRLFMKTIKGKKVTRKSPLLEQLVYRLYETDIKPGAKRDKAWLERIVRKVIPDAVADKPKVAASGVQDIVEKISPEVSKAIAELPPNVVASVANDVAVGVIDQRNADEVIKAIVGKLERPEVTIISTPVKRGRGRPRKIPSQFLIDGATTEEIRGIENVVANVRIAELAETERAAQAIRQVLNIPEQFDVIPSRAGNTLIQLRNNPSVRVVVNKLGVEYVVNGETVRRANTIANLHEGLDIVARNAQEILPLDEIQRVASSMADAVEVEISVPSITKISEPANLGDIKIPGTTKKIANVAHGSVLRSDGSLLTNVIDLSKGIGDINPQAHKLGIPTKLGLLSPEEIAALPKEALATVLDDLQAVRLEVINGLNSLNAKGYKAVAIPLETTLDTQNKVTAWLENVLPDSKPLVLGTPKNPELRMFAKDIPIGFHGTAIDGWAAVRNPATEAVNRLGFGTYVSFDMEHAIAASKRVYDNTLSTNLRLSDPSVYQIVPTRDLALLNANTTKVNTQVLREFMEAVLPEDIDIRRLFNTPMNITVADAYNRIINNAVKASVLDEYQARVVLAAMDEWVTRLGYDGLYDLAGGQAKITATHVLDSVLVRTFAEPNVDKFALLDSVLKRHQVEQVGKFSNKLDWSRLVDTKYELLKHVNSVLDDSIRKASEVRVAQVMVDDAVGEGSSFYSKGEPMDALDNIRKDEQYYDDIQNVGSKIEPDDVCGF